MHAVLIALVTDCHIAASTQGAVSMLRISSDWHVWSMKWLSIFGSVALARFSHRKH
jgi:hypothetical protein